MIDDEQLGLLAKPFLKFKAALIDLGTSEQ